MPSKSKEERIDDLEQKVFKLEEEVKLLRIARINDLNMENKLLKERLNFYVELAAVRI